MHLFQSYRASRDDKDKSSIPSTAYDYSVELAVGDGRFETCKKTENYVAEALV